MKTKVCHFLAVVLFVSACNPASNTRPQINPTPAPTADATSLPPSAAKPIALADCAWGATAKAWIDEKKDGIWGSDEQPLENALFFIDDTLNNYKDVGSYAVSNAKGEAELYVWLPGCPKVAFEVYAEAPDNYRPTSNSRISADPQKSGETFEFGFIYKQGPTATPRPTASIACNPYDVNGTSQLFSKGIVTDMAVAPDGAVWVTTNDNLVARFAPDDQERAVFSTRDGIPDEIIRTITLAPDGTVWVGTNEGAAHLDGSTWTVYTTTTQTGLSANQVEDIAIAPDGKVWLANYLYGVSRFNPKMNTMETDVISRTLLTSDYGIDAIQVSPTGSVWFFSGASIYQLTSSPESKWIVHKQDDNDKLGGLIALNSQSSIVVSDDVIWLVGSTDDGASVVKLNPTMREWTTYNYRATGGAMFGSVISSLAIAQDNSLWIGLYETGLIHFIPNSADEQSGTWLYYNTDNGLLSNNVHKVVVAPDGYIWFGSDTGFVARCIENK